MRRRCLGLGLVALAAAPAAAQSGHVERVDALDAQPDVVAKLGAELALTIRPSGRPIGAQATLREVWRLPSPGARDPADGAVKLEFASRFDVRLGDTLRRQFVFDQPWKIVRGEWLVEYWDGTRKLLNRKFILK